MRSKVFKIAFLLLLSINAFGQFRLTGIVSSAEDSTTVKECIVHLNDGKRAAFVDQNGRFVFNDLAAGSYVLHFTSSDFEYLQATTTLVSGDGHVRIFMKPRRQILSEVMVSDASGNFGFTKLRAVENMGIYEGKKTEVIIPDKLVANVSTNNARQIYSRVAGLNIWENDGGGLQLSIGGRGLDPNRTANFNVRQNGYDISADALGYPESYYTPPVEGIGKIQIVRGAASLQYGTQFGGLINFQMKTPVENRGIELTARQTVGSFGFYNSFTSASGTVGKISYYSFFQYKRADGWRKNSGFDSYTGYANLNYKLADRTRIGVDYTLQDYLAQQPGGMTDVQFGENPRYTNRERNWFKVNWNLFALHIDHKFNTSSEFNVRVFGLAANRYSVGFRPPRPATEEDPENYDERDLIKGNFNNWGVEARFLTRYQVGKVQSVLLAGARYYDGFNHSRQGEGTNGKNADFSFVNQETSHSSDYRFPNTNASAFVEQIFFFSDKFSLTPGARLEYINTTAKGINQFVPRDNAGNILEIKRTTEHRNNARTIVLAGLGASFKPKEGTDIYFNISQNYRSITFNDMQIRNPSSRIDPNLKDERGSSIDLGIRNDAASNFNYDVSLFYLNYNNRIGETDQYDSLNNLYKFRTNVGQAVISGIEMYGEADAMQLIMPGEKKWSGVLFANLALIQTEYRRSAIPGIEGNKVEFVPDANLKSGIRLGYGKLKGSLQYSWLSDQFSDARNDGGKDDAYAVFGIIPAYSVMDLSLSYEFRKLRLEGSINNLADQMYFTRRATGYPGPGIIPSDGRSFFLTAQIKL
jgi:Fe(3+) dicitrate transport protein